MSLSVVRSSLRTGRRRVTPEMFRQHQALEEFEVADASRSEVIQAVRLGGQALGVPRRVREFLVYLISRTFPDDWRPGATPISAPSNADIAAELEIERTQIKTLARSAAELGLLAFKDSATGARFVRRSGPGGAILFGYGFDLSPLQKRYRELHQARMAADDRRREGNQLRRQIGAAGSRIRGLLSCALEAGGDRAEIERLSRAVSALIEERGSSRDPRGLAVLLARLDVLDGEAKACVSATLAVKTDPPGSVSRPPILTTNQTTILPSVEKEGPKGPRAHEAERSRDRRTSQEPSMATADVLRGFKAPPGFLLQIAPVLRDFCETSRPSELQVIEAAALAAHPLGISQHAWAQACGALGRYGAAVAIAVVSALQAEGRIRQPGGWLRALIARHQSGELHLDRTLYGLADRLEQRFPTVATKPRLH